MERYEDIIRIENKVLETNDDNKEGEK
jgi:hypothetical protein